MRERPAVLAVYWCRAAVLGCADGTIQYPSADKTPLLISKKKVSPYKLLIFNPLTKSHQKYEKQVNSYFSSLESNVF
jgi:hypothetical protein